MNLAEEIYNLCKNLPKEELYGLTSQLKRASASIVANIAEGFGRYSYRDKAHHYVISRGECSEVIAFLYLTVRVHLLREVEIRNALTLAVQTRRLLSGLISSSRQRSTQNTP